MSTMHSNLFIGGPCDGERRIMREDTPVKVMEYNGFDKPIREHHYIRGRIECGTDTFYFWLHEDLKIEDAGCALFAGYAAREKQDA
jgi:hypothetical protein